jgi:crossover junction endodeoxyribonuclease RuvC
MTVIEQAPMEPATHQPPHVIGVDLSLTATGMSDGSTTWLVRSAGHRGDDLTSRRDRLSRVITSVVKHIRDLEPALVVVEGPSLGQGRQSGTHDRAGLWWLLVDWCHEYGRPIVEVPPAALKKYATGKGNANKGAVIDATARRFPDVDTAADDNRCDALWLAHMGLDQLTGSGVVPAAQRAGLAKVHWPEVAA